MSRKSIKATMFAVAATMVFTIANADSSGAIAQDAPDFASTAAAPTSAVEADQAPEVRFVAQEVVQPVDENAATDVADAETLQQLVESMPAHGELSSDMRCLAQAIYFEARGEPLDGQLAVGRVIVNRAESSRFPDSYCGVVTQRSQFSFVRGGRIPNVNPNSAAWMRAKAIARIAHQELWDSAAHDALFFHATYVKPSWANRKVAAATIDRHIFYR